MQVKKFEARTMKEALEMVKAQLGPEAIILSARDNNKSYGLVGEGSVEITAAVSEETLRKKQFTESKLREQDKEKFLRSPARAQKNLIDSMVNKHISQNQTPQITQRRYIDIEDERAQQQQANLAEERIKQAAQRALSALQMEEGLANKSIKKQVLPNKAAPSAKDNQEIASLKSEIESLKSVISSFQSVPQSFSNSYPGADFGISYDLSFMFEKLVIAGISREIAAELLDKAQKEIPTIKQKNRSLIEGWVARAILENTKIAVGPTGAKVHCFFGPSGSGKTSTMIKLASHMVVRENKKIALITTDTFKVGAADQMKIYAQILNVPFSIIRHQGDWNHILKYMNNFDAVLVDFAGFSLKNADELKNLKAIQPPAQLNACSHLVLPATAKDQDAIELGRRYSVIGFKDVIFTGLDESSQHGTIYNFMKTFDIPIHSFGIGSRVPEDYEFATKERVLDLIFKITQQKEQRLAAV